MGINTRKLGQEQETRAVKYLQTLGYQIIATNWHWSNRGEIDIIAQDPNRYGKSYWIFVEVKSRRHSMNMSLHAISHKKITQIKKLAQIFLLQRKINPNQVNISFDFIAIHEEEIQHIKDIVR